MPVLRTVTASTIEFLRPIPSVALIPLVVVLYGVTITSTLVLVVYASFWQVLIQVLHGVADVDPVARDTAYAYHLGFRHRVRYVVWPTTLPYAVTGIRLATAVALILTITGETGSGNLLGNLLCALTGLLDGAGALAAILNIIDSINNLLGAIGGLATPAIAPFHGGFDIVPHAVALLRSA